MRLIDADELMKCIPIEEYCSRLAVVNAPTVDVEPERKKGKWIHGKEKAREMRGSAIVSIIYDGWYCPECSKKVEDESMPLYRFCRYCGAEMEGANE